jgi:hypothetical protein
VPDIGDYFGHVEHVGIISDTGEVGLESLARAICTDLYNRIPGESVAAALYAQSVAAKGAAGGMSLLQARQAVGFAQQDLCPGAPAPGLLYAPQPVYVPLSPQQQIDAVCDFACRVARDHRDAITNNGTFWAPG